MEVTEKVKKEIEREIIVSRTCDWCLRDMPFQQYDDPALEMHEVSAYINVSVTDYADQENNGGVMVGWKVEDLCEGCMARMKQLLIDAGVKVVDYTEKWGTAKDSASGFAEEKIGS